MINAILPPFFDDFLVAMETIPPASIKNATIIPAEPETSQFSCNAFDKPAAQDWKVTRTNKTMDRIPETSFQVFISNLPPYFAENVMGSVSAIVSYVSEL